MKALDLLSALHERAGMPSSTLGALKTRLLGPSERAADPRPVGPSRRGRTLAIAMEGLRDESGRPVEGALAWLEEAVERFDVAILSAEAQLPGGDAIPEAWLRAHGLPPHVVARIRFPAHKPPADVYLDPRALRFVGTFPDVRALLRYALASQ